MARLTYLIILLLLSVSLLATEQHGGTPYQPKSPPLERLITQLIEGLEDDEQRAIIIERIEQLYYAPLDLNKATAQDLEEVPFFNDFFIRNFLLMRSQKGGFITLYDLREVPGAPIEQLPILEPLLCMGASPYGQEQAPLRQQFYFGADSELPLIPREGQKFLPGLGLRFYSEREGKYRWGFLLGKDKREPFLPIRQGVMDYLSITYEQQLKKARILIGDYQMTSGMGLLMGQSLSYFARLEQSGKPRAVRQGGMRPHLSFREYNFLRGAAWEQQWNKSFRSQLFYGMEALDVRLEHGGVRTIYRTGMHREGGEVRYRKQVRLHTLGAHLMWQSKQLELGLLSLQQIYLAQGRRRLLPPKPFHTEGYWVRQASLHFKLYPTYQLQFFGEALLARREQALAILGASYQADYFGSLTIALRYLGKNATTAYGRPDARYTNLRDERGIQVVWQGELPFPYWSATAYFDLFQRLSHLSHPDSPSGHLFSFKAERSTYQGYLYLRYRSYQPVGKPRSHTLRCSTYQRLTEHWSVRAGGQVKWISRESQDYTLYARLRYESTSPALRVDAGGQYFRSSFSPIRSDNAYMPYRYYTPFLRGTGLRLQASLKWQPRGQLALYSRLSHTLYTTQQRPSTPLPSLFDLGAIFKF